MWGPLWVSELNDGHKIHIHHHFIREYRYSKSQCWTRLLQRYLQVYSVTQWTLKYHVAMSYLTLSSEDTSEVRKFLSNVLMITKATPLCLKVHKLTPLVLQITVLLTWRWAWNICAIIMREKTLYLYNLHSFHWHVQDVMIPCSFQELLSFLSVMYLSLPPSSINYFSSLFHLILPSISSSTSQSCCSQIHT